MKKYLSVLLCLFLSIPLVGCKKTSDEEFKKNIILYAEKNWNKTTKMIEDDNISDSEFLYERGKLLEKEIDVLKPFKNKDFKDSNLKDIFIDYLSIIEEEKRLNDKYYKDETDGEDDKLETALYYKANKILIKLYDKYDVEFSDNFIKEIKKELKDYKNREKERSIPLTDNQKKLYSSNIDFNSLIEKPDEYKKRKIVFTGKVFNIHTDGEELYINFYVNNDANKDMFIFYKKSILDKNFKKGDYIRCYFDYTGMENCVYTDGTETEIPGGFARAVEFIN